MKTLVLLAMLALAGRTVASEEDFAVWRNLKVATESIPRAGEVRVKAASGEAGIERFEISAFGKSYPLTETEIKKISEFPLSSLSITHGPGYRITGGL